MSSKPISEEETGTNWRPSSARPTRRPPWPSIDLKALEDLRLRLRGLVPFLDRKKRKIVYTDFQDQVMGVREEAAVYMPKMTGSEFEKKVKGYLRNHMDHLSRILNRTTLHASTM